MDKILITSLPHLNESQKAILRKGNVITVADLVLTPPQELSKRCRIQPSDVIRLIQDTCTNQDSLAFTFRTLENVDQEEHKIFSAGDSVLDDTLGGGLQTGMIWEIVGESAAGKTQFALQLSLYVQLSPSQGGLGGAACYLTTSTKLQTPRLLQIQQMRNLSGASLEDVHTLSTPTVHILLNVLENQLPILIETSAKAPSRKPVKLLVIDALAELFHLVEKVSTASLVERSQKLTQISSLLHRVADRYDVAIVVLNEVVDAFDHYATALERSENGLLLYSEQAKWFNRGNSVYGENKKEASLGLVWANQVNARIMLTRTGRRRFVEEAEEEEGEKRQKMQEGGVLDSPRSSNTTTDREPSLIRRMTVIFNSTGSLRSCDYTVVPAGVKGLSAEDKPLYAHSREWTRNGGTGTQPSSSNPPSALPPHQVQVLSQSVIPSSQEEEEYDDLWKDDEFYENIDWDSLEQILSQAQGENS